MHENYCVFDTILKWEKCNEVHELEFWKLGLKLGLYIMPLCKWHTVVTLLEWYSNSGLLVHESLKNSPQNKYY
jgi:hypothetical protein